MEIILSNKNKILETKQRFQYNKVQNGFRDLCEEGMFLNVCFVITIYTIWIFYMRVDRII